MTSSDSQTITTEYRSRKVYASLEKRIQHYIKLLDEGWGRNLARAKAGIRMGRKDYWQVRNDKRVVAAHLRHAQIKQNARKLVKG